ncbi:MAG: hypothetical protein HC890_18285 [Chloroflexaceae bacterium]|nr:hypothetical protein [Chloroflexaceae bacterium]
MTYLWRQNALFPDFQRDSFMVCCEDGVSPAGPLSYSRAGFDPLIPPQRRIKEND